MFCARTTQQTAEWCARDRVVMCARALTCVRIHSLASVRKIRRVCVCVFCAKAQIKKSHPGFFNLPIVEYDCILFFFYFFFFFSSFFSILLVCLHENFTFRVWRVTFCVHLARAFQKSKLVAIKKMKTKKKNNLQLNHK